MFTSFYLRHGKAKRRNNRRADRQTALRVSACDKNGQTVAATRGLLGLANDHFTTFSLSFTTNGVEHSDDGDDHGYTLPSVPPEALEPLFILRVISPALVLLSTLSIIFTSPPPPQFPSAITSRSLSYSMAQHSSSTLYSPRPFAGLAALGAWKDINGVDVWSLKRLKFSIFAALALDIAQVVILSLSIQRPFSIEFLHLGFPSFRVLLLAPLWTALLYPRVTYVPVQSADETAPTASSLLLPAEAGAAPSTGLSPLSAEVSKYGTFRSTRSTLNTSGPTTRTHTPAPSQVRLPPPKAKTKEDIALDPSWREIGRRIKHITPYLWPSKSHVLQLLALLCMLLIVVGRVVNFLVPLVFAELVRVFEEGSRVSPWPYLFAYVALRFLQASGGLAALRDTLWVPVMQYSDREMSQLSFDHLLNLSFAFHTHRKTGEVLRILDRGAAINHTLETILFNIIPTFLDIVIALIFFCVYFEWTLGLVIFVVMVAYVMASVVLTKWRTKLRRQMNDRDMVTRGIHTDCLLNYETVKYFNGEQHEGERYREAIRQYQALEYKVMVSLNLLNLVQNFIITLGTLVGSMIVALRVVRGESQPHEFVFFITYLAQLYGPLNMLGYLYRSINQSLVDTERLLSLLSEPTEINDRPNAPDLLVDHGEIEFDNVNFSYDGRSTALNGVSFKVPKGSSVALVGESGSGKSTILRLLYRFYDLKDGDGRILIDGQDIRDVTQSSLRKAIGVVPQDPVLFNASISYNIGYGKFGAQPEEIETAAKAAQMHDRITSFPDGYDTKVGERGVRLSGGEKQRVAIARTLLKNPPILLLDEATSALDTSTEKDIQKALQHLVEGRSSLSIAHRLSTIASADLILVLKDGQIVEQGTHSELLARDGVFAAMWADQVSGTEDTASSHKREAVAGYMESEEPTKVELDSVQEGVAVVPEIGTEEIATAVLVESEGTLVEPAPLQDVISEIPPTIAPVAIPSSETAERVRSYAIPEPSIPISDSPVAFPSPTFPRADGPGQFAFPDGADAAPVGFPSPVTPASVSFPSPETASQREGSVSASPGVTFQDGYSSPRTGTPDPEADGKRKRTLSTQGIQRLARRISLTPRRQGSSSIPMLAGAIIPGLKRENTSGPSSNKDEGSVKETRDSPSASVSSDIGKTKSKKDKKKDKKDKRKSMS
ncbi:ATP-binding cassette sub-family B member 6, mitochondrial [Grifola frondosa]|uniref:ATP-binding cassette sub-family B member 6, mitochondrial n=1 Tax=Grifola frondosa TaxID=5627 RepID=A0A1C7LTU9_GRIFR|nr:ATP-binding cassette sub-family B member 6, mitochondrial [Grifola frondosa]